jgi:hypothetical protein
MSLQQQFSATSGGLLIISTLKQNAGTPAKLVIDAPIFAIGSTLRFGGVGINSSAVAFDADPPNIAITMDRGGDSAIWDFIKNYNPAFMPSDDDGVAQSQYENGLQTPATPVPEAAKVHLFYKGPSLYTVSNNVKEHTENLIIAGTVVLSRSGGNFTTGFKQKIQPAFTFEFLKNDLEFECKNADVTTMLTAATALLPDGLPELAKLKEMITGLDLSYDANVYPAPYITGN